MDLSSEPTSTARAVRAAARTRQVVGAGARWCVERLCDLWLRVGPGRQPIGLDAAACRDLGLSRCELASYRAESLGLAPRTRRRVAEHVR